MKLAIVSFEFEGLTKNGGIGTAYRRLGELLARRKHQVTFVFVPFGWDKNFSQMKRAARGEIARLQKLGIEVVIPEFNNYRVRGQTLGYHLKRSLAVYDFLKSQDFDLVHVSDNCALAYFALLAKNSGTEFQNCHFAVGSHGSPFWTAMANREFHSEPIALSQLDRASLAMADSIVSPSQYMLDYLKAHDWVLPPSVFVIPNINKLSPGPAAQKTKAKARSADQSKTVIFFGRIEERKGVNLFIDAIKRLLAAEPFFNDKQKLRIVFLGKDLLMNTKGSPASEWISEKFKGFRDRLDLKFFSNLSSEASLKYIGRRPGDLVCMPSLVDNSPYVIVEALEAGMNFLATDSGGQAELIHPADRHEVLCKPETGDLARALRHRLFSEPLRVRPSDLAMKANGNWIRFHEKTLKKRNAKKEIPGREPLVTVILTQNTEFGGPDFQERLQSLREQTYKNIEVCIPKGFEEGLPPRNEMKISFYEKRDSSPQVMGEVVGRLARGKYVLFLDGGCLTDSAALGDWVRFAEGWGTRHPRVIGVTSLIRAEGYKPGLDSLILPTPQDPILTMMGEQPVNRFTLWVRSKLIRSGEPLLLGEGRSLKSLCSRLVARGFEMVIHPRVAVAQKANAYFHEDENLMTTMEPFLSAPPKEWRRYLYLVAGMRKDLRRMENYLQVVRNQFAFQSMGAAKPRKDGKV